MRNLEMTQRHLPIVRSDNVEITGNLLNSTSLKNGKYECMVNKTYCIRWTIKNLRPDECKFIFRVCPVQETNSGILFHNSTGMIILGTSVQVLPLLYPAQEYKLDTHFLFQKPGIAKIMSHVQRIEDKSEIVTSVAEMNISWLQSGIHVVVFE